MVYLPGARSLTSYAPTPSDVADTTSPLEFLTVMLAPGMTAPVASTICPRSRPVWVCACVCAKTEPEQATRMKTTQAEIRTRFPDSQNFINLSSTVIVTSRFTAGQAHCGPPPSPPG